MLNFNFSNMRALTHILKWTMLLLVWSYLSCDLEKIDETDVVLPVQFSKTLGLPGENEQGAAVLQLAGGGYLVVAENSTCPADKCLQVYKLDKDGNTEAGWPKTYAYQTFNKCYPVALAEVPGGGFVIAGHVKSGTNEIDAYAMKIDANGNVNWQQKYGIANNPEYFRSVTPTNDGGFAFAGSNSDDYLNFVVKTNGTGDKTWERTLPGSGFGVAIHSLSTGGFMMLPGWSGDKVSLLQLTSTGNVDKTVQFGDANSNVSNDMIPTKDGGWLITGERGFDQYTEIYLLKVKSDLTKQWEITFPDKGWFEAGRALTESSDGSFGILATRELNVLTLIKVDANGNEKFFKEIGAGLGYDIDACSDGGFVITGDDKSNGIFVIKTDKDGNF